MKSQIPITNNTVTGLAPADLSQKFLHRNVWSLNLGKMSILAPKEVKLLQFIFEHCKQGINVTTRMVRIFSKKQLPELCIKAGVQKISVFGAFTIKSASPISFLLTHHKKLAKKRRPHVNFMEFMRHKATQMHPDHVLNMD